MGRSRSALQSYLRRIAPTRNRTDADLMPSLSDAFLALHGPRLPAFRTGFRCRATLERGRPSALAPITDSEARLIAMMRNPHKHHAATRACASRAAIRLPRPTYHSGHAAPDTRHLHPLLNR